MDIVCKCKHAKAFHAIMNGDVVGGREVCFAFGPETTIDECPCYNYVPDNLSHIEKLAKERNLV